jgi:RNA polymerase sigma factor (sigma-70 family)
MIRFLAFSKMGIRGAISRYWKTFDVVKNASLHEVEDFPEEPADNLGRTKRRLFLAEEEVLRDYTPHVNPVVEDNSLVDPDFDSIETREQMKLVAEAMKDRLTDQERMVIDLVYRDGFSFQDIGNMLDITRAAVLSAHSKALKKIRIDLARQKRLLIRK